MVKCTNGLTVIEVTEGAYNSIFKDQGFRPIETTKKKETAKVETVGEEVVEGDTITYEAVEDDEFASLLEKPIGQWSNEEVKTFAEAKGINISGTKNAKEAKARIRKFLDDVEQ